MYLVLGDWSDDGHGKHDKILLESNVSIDEIQQAYKDSCKLTGVAFNINEDFTETNRPWQEADLYRIACEYDEGNLSMFVFGILAKYGLTREMLNEWDVDGNGDYEDEDYDPVILYKESYVSLWIWFVKLSLPKTAVIKTADAKDEIPVINGYWNKNLNVQFGYGLFF